ncbi:MAG: hypothetical protein WCS30_03625 [Selenomonadaceae bacterium]
MVYVLVFRGHIAACIVVVVLVYAGEYFLVDALACDDHLVLNVLCAAFGDGGYDRFGAVVLAVVVPRHPCKPCFCVEKLLSYCKILKIRLL